MRLIDADALKEVICNNAYFVTDFFNSRDYGMFWTGIEKAIDEAPTIDAVEVVRCKDCRWFDKKTEHSSYGYCHAMKHAYLSKNWEISIYKTQKEDFYCADGEKMYEEEDR